MRLRVSVLRTRHYNIRSGAMSSILTRKPGRTNSDASPEAIDPDSFDLDLFDQLANQPRKKSRGIRFCGLSEDEELPETDVADDEIGDEFESEDSTEEYEEDVDEVEEEEEYIPVRSRRATISRTPAARSSASSRSMRTPARSTRTGTSGTSGTIVQRGVHRFDEIVRNIRLADLEYRGERACRAP